MVLVREALETSEIEGERLDPGDARSSAARCLGLPSAELPAKSDRQADGVADGGRQQKSCRNFNRNGLIPTVELARRFIAVWPAFSLFPTMRKNPLQWSINGRMFEMENVDDDEIVRLGSKEIWEFHFPN